MVGSLIGSAEPVGAGAEDLWARAAAREWVCPGAGNGDAGLCPGVCGSGAGVVLGTELRDDPAGAYPEAVVFGVAGWTAA